MASSTASFSYKLLYDCLAALVTCRQRSDELACAVRQLRAHLNLNAAAVISRRAAESPELFSTDPANDSAINEALDQLLQRKALPNESQLIHSGDNFCHILPIDPNSSLILVSTSQIADASIDALQPILEWLRFIVETGSAAPTPETADPPSDAFRNTLESLVTSLAAASLNVQHDALPNWLTTVLNRIGSNADVERIFLFLFDGTDAGRVMAKEWHQPSAQPMLETLKNMSEQQLNKILQRTDYGETITLKRRDELAGDEPIASFMAALEADSIIIVPIMSTGKAIGFMGMSNIHDNRLWAADFSFVLFVLGELLTGLWQRYRSERALKASRETSRALLNAPNDLAMLLDTDGKILEANQAAASFFDKDLPSLIGSSLFSRYAQLEPPLARARRESLAVVVESAQPFRFEEKIGDHWYKNTIYPILEAKRVRRLAYFAHDITEQKRLEESLRQSDKLKSDFIANVSHELRTPLASILGFAHTILHDPEMADDVQREFMGIIYEESERLHRLIENVLDITRIEAGRVSYKRHKLDVVPVLNETIYSFENNIETKELHIENKTDSAPPVFSNSEALQQVFGALLNNAIKFSHKGGTILVSKEIKEDSLQISITDDGLGIPAADLPHIFEKFYRVDRKGALIEGTGLGLFIAKEIVELLNGKLFVKSKPDHGSSFTVQLPLYHIND